MASPVGQGRPAWRRAIGAVTRIGRPPAGARQRPASTSAPGAPGAAGGEGASAPETPAAAALRELDAGQVPDQLAALIAEQVREADALFAAGRVSASVAPLTAAAGLAFHRTLHFDAPTSPLASDPEGFLAPLHASPAWRRAGEGRGRRTPAAAPDRDRPTRLLMVSYKNWQFAQPLVDHYRDRPDVELRTLDLGDLSGLPLSPLQQIRLRLTGPDDARGLPWAAPIVEQLDWADTIFVDWLQRGASLITSLDPGAARVIVRLHSFEVFTPFAHLVDYSRVDDLVVVGTHLGRLLHRSVPAAGGPRLRQVANAADLRRLARPKSDQARFTLAVLGYGKVVKDALWAVELLARLRAADPRYRLLLIGHDFPVDGPGGTEAYRQRLAARMAEPDVAGAVQKLPFTTDVAGALAEVGVVLSSSVRESFHVALVEGAASGAVPVVRNWPLFAQVGGPTELFPAEWVVPDVPAAAARVLATTADEDTWRHEGEQARAWVLDRYDWTATRPHYDELLLGLAPGTADPAGS